MRSPSDGVADQLLTDLAATTGDETVSMATRLEAALPADLALEEWLQRQEQRFDVHLSDADLHGCFTTWTVGNLAASFTRKAMAKISETHQWAHKLATSALRAFHAPGEQKTKSHQRYLAHRGQAQQRAKVYRVAHMAQIRRRSRAYRKKVKRHIIRPKKQVGTAAGGFSFIPR